MVNCYIFCLFVGMSSFLKKNKALFLRNSLWAIGVLFCLIAFHHPVLAQKPGKEKIEIQFPEDIKWKREKVKTETASIRHEVFTPRNPSENEKVVKVDVLTIDKRFFPVSVKETLENSWKLRQSICPNSSLDIVYQEKDDKGVKLIYILKNPAPTNCTEPAWIFLAAEGPTALHTIEVRINKDLFDSEISEKWIEILKNRVIK